MTSHFPLRPGFAPFWPTSGQLSPLMSLNRPEPANIGGVSALLAMDGATYRKSRLISGLRCRPRSRRRPKISALCSSSLGATVRTRMLSPILTGVRMWAPRPVRDRPQHLRVVINRAARHAGCFEHLDPIVMVLVVSTAFITASSASRFPMRCWWSQSVVVASFRAPQSLRTARRSPRRRHPPSR